MEIIKRDELAIEATPSNILQDAVQKGASVETLTKLLELQERWEANQARKAFDTAFAQFKQEAPRLERSKEVSFGGNKTAYKYTPLDAICNVLAPILSKYGFSYNWRQESSKDGIIVTCILRHSQGHSVENTLSAQADPSGSKNAIQAIGSAVSYLRRYTLLGSLGLATGDEDNDGMPEGAEDIIQKISEAQTLDELSKRYREAQADAVKKKDVKAIGHYALAFTKRRQELGAA